MASSVLGLFNFNPAIIPDVTQFTPDPGTSTLDSAIWTGDFLVLDPTNPLSVKPHRMYRVIMTTRSW